MKVLTFVKVSLLAVVLFASLLVVFTYSSNTAQANNINIISGRVTTTDGSPLEGIFVSAAQFISTGPDDGYVAATYQGQTDLFGYYEIEVASPGEYRLEFRDLQHPWRVLPKYYLNADTREDATLISIGEGESITGIDAQLPHTSSISGKVTDPSGEAVYSAVVDLLFYSNSSDSWQNLSTKSLDTTGVYTLSGLPPGTFRLKFDTQHISRPKFYPSIYENTDDFDFATDIILNEGESVTNINGELLPLPNQIGGVVTNGSGEPLQNIRATLWQQNENGDWNQSQFNDTNPQGWFIFTDLEPGLYQVGYNHELYSEYATEFYDDADGLNGATSIALNSGDSLLNIDATMHKNSLITGRVVNKSGEPVENIAVNAYRLLPQANSVGSWGIWKSSFTDANGRYEINGLEADEYRLGFWDASFPSIYIDEFYQDAYDLESATTITVGRSITVANIDVELSSGGSISGTITDRDGLPIVGIHVLAFQQRLTESGESVWEEAEPTAFDTTDEQGRYLLERLSPGIYRVKLNDFDLRRYSDRYYPSASSIESASDVVVEVDTVTPNIDMSLVKPQGISGQVVNQAGEPVNGLIVSAYGLAESALEPEWNLINYTSTNEAGHYQLLGLAEGAYRVGYGITDFPSDGRFVPEYYSDAETITDAQDIEVAAVTITQGINAQLAPRGKIGGLIIDEGGQPLQGIAVQLSSLLTAINGNRFWKQTNFTQTDTQGYYLVDGLLPGTYRVGAGDGSSFPPLFRWEYFDNELLFDDASDIIISASSIITNVNFELRNFTNEVPVANNDHMVLYQGRSTNILSNGANSILSNDIDLDGDPLSIIITNLPRYGNLDFEYTNGEFVYSHYGSDIREDFFTYKLYDGYVESDIVTVTIEVLPVASMDFTTAIDMLDDQPSCSKLDDAQIAKDEVVTYCFTIHNTGITTLTNHILTDASLGRDYEFGSLTLSPASSYITAITETVGTSVTKVFYWSATPASSSKPITSSDAVTVTILGPGSEEIPGNVPEPSPEDNESSADDELPDEPMYPPEAEEPTEDVPTEDAPTEDDNADSDVDEPSGGPTDPLNNEEPIEAESPGQPIGSPVSEEPDVDNLPAGDNEALDVDKPIDMPGTSVIPQPTESNIHHILLPFVIR